MRFTLAIAIVLFCGASAFALEQECRGQDIKQIAQPGMLVISEAAITRTLADCPTVQDDIGTEFAAIPHQSVFLWFRVEGRRGFLDTIQRRDRFRLRVTRRDDVAEGSSPLQIFDPYFNIPALRNEAEQYGGYFDWRFRANIKAFYVPGEYRMQVTFGGKPVCFSGGNCELKFRVTP